MSANDLCEDFGVFRDAPALFAVDGPVFHPPVVGLAVTAVVNPDAQIDFGAR